jgi:hypothetical protein
VIGTLRLFRLVSRLEERFVFVVEHEAVGKESAK